MTASANAGGPRGSARSVIFAFSLQQQRCPHAEHEHADLWHGVSVLPGATLSGAGIRAVTMWLPQSATEAQTWCSRPHLMVWRLFAERAHVVYFDGDLSVLIARGDAEYEALNANAERLYPPLWEPYEALKLNMVNPPVRCRPGPPPGTVKTAASTPRWPAAPTRHETWGLPPRTAQVSRALLRCQQECDGAMIAAEIWLHDSHARSVRATAAALREAQRAGLASHSDGRWRPTALARTISSSLEARHRKERDEAPRFWD
jgi:hypothetical protein